MKNKYLSFVGLVTVLTTFAMVQFGGTGGCGSSSGGGGGGGTSCEIASCSDDFTCQQAAEDSITEGNSICGGNVVSCMTCTDGCCVVSSEASNCTSDAECQTRLTELAEGIEVPQDVIDGTSCNEESGSCQFDCGTGEGSAECTDSFEALGAECDEAGLCTFSVE